MYMLATLSGGLRPSAHAFASFVQFAGGTGAATLATELRAAGVRVESSLPGLIAELRRARVAA
jgi:hypothetical protein